MIVMLSLNRMYRMAWNAMECGNAEDDVSGLLWTPRGWYCFVVIIS